MKQKSLYFHQPQTSRIQRIFKDKLQTEFDNMLSLLDF